MLQRENLLGPDPSREEVSDALSKFIALLAAGKFIVLLAASDLSP